MNGDKHRDVAAGDGDVLAMRLDGVGNAGCAPDERRNRMALTDEQQAEIHRVIEQEVMKQLQPILDRLTKLETEKAGKNDLPDEARKIER